MKQVILIFLLLYSSAFAVAVKVQKSFTIQNDSSVADVQFTQIGESTNNSAWGRVPDIDIAIWKVGAITKVPKDNRVVGRFEHAYDSLAALLASDTGVITIDSGKIGLIIYEAGDPEDQWKMGVGILRPGQGMNSRHFQKGNGASLGDSGGVTFDACVAPYNSPSLDSLPWTTPGAKAATDTLGGVIWESPWQTTETDTAGGRFYFLLPGWSIEAMFDSSTSAKDTTAAHYAGHVFYITDSVDVNNDNVGRTFCSGSYGDLYCNTPGCEPSLTIWVSFTQNREGLQSIGHSGSDTLYIGRPVTSMGR
jgi:hypothetical protein